MRNVIEELKGFTGMENIERFIITKAMVEGAKSYLPITLKTAIARTYASVCLAEEKSEMQEMSDLILPLPQLLSEDVYFKSLATMEIFLTYYFGVDIPDGGMTNELYDYYASSHPFNQLERFKGDAEMRDKIFDLLSDYKELKKMLDVAIYNARALNNDSFGRILAGLSTSITPDMVNATLKEVAELSPKVKERLQMVGKKAKEARAKMGKAQAETASPTAKESNIEIKNGDKQ